MAQLTEIELNKLKEAVDILMGWRPLKGSRPGKAVTQKELQQLQDAVNRVNAALKGTLSGLTSAQVTAAPTAADFNKLQADVAAIHTMLTGLISQASS